jgi:hypothetical protein
MRLLRFYAFGAALWAVSGCGSRTGLLVLDELPDEPEAGLEASDATMPEDAGYDAPPDVVPDRFVDAGMDAEPDVTVDAVADVVVDVLPPIDVAHPPPVACLEAGAASTLIYLVTLENDLWSFYPPSLSFSRIGHLNCPTTNTPFSMAVDQAGIAYVLYSDGTNGHLFRVSTATARCQATSFAVDQEQFRTFGMGYSQNPSGVDETLYIASDEQADSGLPARLGLIDTTAFAVHTVGPFVPQLSSAELTGTGAGDLFAFYALNPTPEGPSGSGPPSAIGHIDKANGRVLGSPTVLPDVAQGCGWAFAFWGGDFYEFVAPPPVGGTCNPPPPMLAPLSVVWRYRPSDGTQVKVASFGETIVGAGVSTCAPQD